MIQTKLTLFSWFVHGKPNNCRKFTKLKFEGTKCKQDRPYWIWIHLLFWHTETSGEVIEVDKQLKFKSHKRMQVKFISNNVDMMTHDCLSSVALALVSTFLSSGLDPVLLVDTSKVVQEQQQSTGHRPSRWNRSLQSSWWTRARQYRNSSGQLGMGPPGKAPPQWSQDQGSRRWWSEDWRGGAVGDAGAEVTMLFWLKLACLYTQVQANTNSFSTDT